MTAGSENTFAFVRDERTFAMHWIGQHFQDAAERFHNALQPKTNTQSRNAALRQFEHEIGDAEIGRTRRAG